MPHGSDMPRKAAVSAAVLPERWQHHSKCHYDGCSPVLHDTILRPIQL